MVVVVVVFVVTAAATMETTGENLVNQGERTVVETRRRQAPKIIPSIMPSVYGTTATVSPEKSRQHSKKQGSLGLKQIKKTTKSCRRKTWTDS